MCEFCENIKSEMLRGDNNTDTFEIRGRGNSYVILYNNSENLKADMAQPVKYCPMCGRRLSEDWKSVFKEIPVEKIKETEEHAKSIETLGNEENKINLNDKIKVKLTPHGAFIYYNRYEELTKRCGKMIIEPKLPAVDSDGYTTFQLHDFIKLYGVHIGMTKENVIDPLDIIVCE